MKVLILGKNGQLGQELVKESKNGGFETLATGSNDLDVTNYTSLKSYILEHRPELIINATAYNLVPQAEEDFENAYRLNAEAVGKMAKAAKEIGAKFVTYSTDYVFDGTKGAPYEEMDNPNPLQKYGQSKLEGENLTLSNHPDGSLVIRTCALYGGKTGSPSKGSNIVLTFLNSAKENKPIQAVNDQFVNPTYSKDLAKSTFDLLEKNPKPGVYHLASEGFCNWVEFVEELLRIAKIDSDLKSVPSSEFPSKIRKPSFTALANTKAKELGVILPTWQKALRTYLEDFDFIASQTA